MSLDKAPITVTLPVTNVARARGFYQNKLGLKAAKEPYSGSASFVTKNGTKIFLYKRGRTRADHTVASFYVRDVPGEVRKLKSKGVKFQSYKLPTLTTDKNNIATWGRMKAAWFKDTEGNILGLINRP